MQTTVAQRLTAAREALGVPSQSNFAKALDITRSTVSVWESGKGNIPFASAQAIERVYGISAIWLLTGKGEMMVVDAKNTAYPESKDSGVVSENRVVNENTQTQAAIEYIRVPVYDIAVSAGHGAVVYGEPDVIRFITFQPEWIHKRIRVPLNTLAITTVSGDSMEPFINHGDMVMFDRSAANEPFRDGVWVFRLGDCVHVKRVQQIKMGTFKAVSENKAYGSFEFEDDYTFLGRVVWSERLW